MFAKPILGQRLLCLFADLIVGQIYTYVGLTAVETIIRKSQVKERYTLEKKKVHTSRQQL